MRVSGLGTVGLPLDSASAERLKAHCTLAPFGRGTRTVVDRTVHDTWEVDANQVSFENPAWKTFLNNVARDVCARLGVDFGASKPRCELHKLLLYETGSHFLPHVDTEKVNGMFATIVIVLPSEFSGGEVHLSHAAKSVAYDCSHTSRFGTSVLAWYTDVTHEVKPIASGHRLALSYNLIHTTNNLRPSLSTNTAIMDELETLFRRWDKDSGDCTIDRIFYLLEHQYSRDNLSGSALKGPDAYKVATLSPLAAAYGFGIGLVNVTCRVTGDCDLEDDVPDSYYMYGKSPTAHGMQFGDVHDHTVRFGNLVDLDGRVLSRTLQHEDDMVYPEEMIENIDEVMCYNVEEYEGYQGNSGGSINRWYRPSMLVMWPKWSSLAKLQKAKKEVAR